jgi:hypothetical protein
MGKIPRWKIISEIRLCGISQKKPVIKLGLTQRWERSASGGFERVTQIKTRAHYGTELKQLRRQKRRRNYLLSMFVFFTEHEVRTTTHGVGRYWE